jgi:hypothetical protein
MGEVAHEILGQRQSLAPQTPKQEELARKPLVPVRLRGDLLHQIA